jgi:putative N6-adenine-specific DNA methylase
VKNNADSRIRELPEGLISGSDSSPRQVSIARKNLNSFAQGANVKIITADFRHLTALENCVIVCNPPYGKRLVKEDTESLLNDLGDFFKQKCAGSTAFVLVGDKEFSGSLRLRTKMDKLVKNGDIDSRLLRVDLYKKK